MTPELEPYASMLREQKVWASGCSVLTCGSTTGHTVAPLAFCNGADTAAVLADAMMQAGHVSALLEALEKADAWLGDYAMHMPDCATVDDGRCDCGLRETQLLIDAAIALARGAK